MPNEEELFGPHILGGACGEIFLGSLQEYNPF
jgi:hypothetical protein